MDLLYYVVLFGLVTHCVYGAATTTTSKPASVTLGCRDIYGKPVDWFTTYKLPKIRDHTSWPDVRTGAAVTYQDSARPGSWRRSAALITSTTSHVAYTIASLYKPGKENLTYIMYNDQPPPDRQNQMNNGHAKGLIIFDGVSGIWLVHSVPNFPPPSTDGSYSYPSSGHLYGQSFLCLTLPASQLNAVATQLYYNNVYVYDKNVPIAVLGKTPYLRLLLDRSRPPPAPYTSVLSLTTLNGTEFVSFAKDGLFRQDLYDNEVAPQLKSDLSVEGWRNGNGNLPSDCNGSYSVMNVNAIHFDAPAELDRDVQFDTNNDHSKWAVSTSADNAWACVGDINRQFGQFRRGGGTVCIKNPAVWKSYNDLISGVDPCDRPTRTNNPKKVQKGCDKARNPERCQNRRNRQQLETASENIDSSPMPILALIDAPTTIDPVEKRCRVMADGTTKCRDRKRNGNRAGKSSRKPSNDLADFTP